MLDYLLCSGPLSHHLALQVVAQQVPVTRQVPKQVTSVVEENGERRQKTTTVMENVHEMVTQHVTVQRPVQVAVKKVSPVQQPGQMVPGQVTQQVTSPVVSSGQVQAWHGCFCCSIVTSHVASFHLTF